MTIQGATYDPILDSARLTTQAVLVRELMSDGKFRTLSEIVAAIGSGSEAGVSARLRDLRKKPDCLIVNKRRRGEAKWGIYEYQLEVSDE